MHEKQLTTMQAKLIPSHMVNTSVRTATDLYF